MRKNISKVTIMLILIFVIFSCANYKNQMIRGKGNLDQARLNSMIDFAYKYKTPKKYLKERGGKPFDVFWVFEKKSDNKDIFTLTIFPENDGYIALGMDDRLGETPNSYFPNRFKEINGNLFVWKDTITLLKSDILQIIDKYKVLDSTDIKRKLGVLPKDFIDNKIVTMDHGLKSTHYYICKNQLNKFKKVKSSVAYGYYRVPNVNCPDNGNELGNGSK